MAKLGLGINVHDESINRIKWTFDNFERIYLSFSAGKDSTVMLHLVAQEAQKRNKKIGLLLVDLEGQYKLTIDHALEMIEIYKDVLLEVYWCCLPIALRNAVSVYEPKWTCWDEEKQQDWIRQIPDIAISDVNYFPFPL